MNVYSIRYRTDGVITTPLHLPDSLRTLMVGWAMDNTPPGGIVLDFGSGVDPVVCHELRNAGFAAVAYESAGKQLLGVHDPLALARDYDTVFCRDVIDCYNNSPNVRAVISLRNVVRLLIGATRPEGSLILNLTRLMDHKQRCAGFSVPAFLRNYFRSVIDISNDPNHLVLGCRHAF